MCRNISLKSRGLPGWACCLAVVLCRLPRSLTASWSTKLPVNWEVCCPSEVQKSAEWENRSVSPPKPSNLDSARHAAIIWGSLDIKLDCSEYLSRKQAAAPKRNNLLSASCINQTCLPCVKLLHYKPCCNYKTLVVPFMVSMVYCVIGWT